MSETTERPVLPYVKIEPDPAGYGYRSTLEYNESPTVRVSRSLMKWRTVAQAKTAARLALSALDERPIYITPDGQ